jgi:predicted DsbA family dithiol-disulfide isomerase
MEPIRVMHFSDALCVWAYVGQARVDELRSQFGAQVIVEPKFCPVFGATHAKLEPRWKDKGGLAGYGAHVRSVVEGFGHVSVHPDVWRTNAPRSSLSCHLFLCAVRDLERTSLDPGAFSRACWALRQAFFRDLEDVSRRDTQLSIAERLGLPIAEIERRLDDGVAHAELSGDYELARELQVNLSPTLILNEGRQRLNGNVGYRVVEANVRELLHQPSGEHASWC